MNNRPHISVALDIDTGQHALFVTSFGYTAPAGPRLFRSPPWPDVRFTHDSQEAAEADRATLQAYLDALPEPKGKKKAGARGAFAD